MTLTVELPFHTLTDLHFTAKTKQNSHHVLHSFLNLVVAGEVVEVEVEVEASLCRDLSLDPLTHISPVSDNCTSLGAPDHQYSPDCEQEKALQIILTCWKYVVAKLTYASTKSLNVG